ncbi:hypothetical protein KRP22_006504 [Phytophthora ramorum]|nr:hypothetical protein KRP22_2366 [Phytophthora ramorum]
MVCAGSLRVRTCKLLWKSAALQLMVTTTTSLSEDESHFDDCEDDSDESGEDDDIEKLTTMARPNKTHHYSLVCCHRSLMGHARRERIELDDPRDPVEFVWGEDGLLSTRFEFSIFYGSVRAAGRRRTLTCRARDAKEYLQWTEALRTAMECQGKNKGDMKLNRSTHARTVASSKAASNSGSFFDADVVEEQQQLLQQQQRVEQDSAWKRIAKTPTSPTAATASAAIAPPKVEIAEESALKPIPADIAAGYGVGRRRQASAVVIPPSRPVGTRLQRRKPSVPASGVMRPSGIAPLRRSSITSKSTASGIQNVTVEQVKPDRPIVTVFRPVPAGQRRRRTSSAARRLSSTRTRKISLSDGRIDTISGAWRPHIPDTNGSSKRGRPRVSPTSEPEEKRPRMPISPLALVPVLGALPMLQSPSSLVDSPFDFIDAPTIDSPRTTELVSSLVKIAKQRQKLLKSRPSSYRYGPPLLARQSEEDAWVMSRRTSRLNLDMCDVEEATSTRSNRHKNGQSWAAYLKAMECEL